MSTARIVKRIGNCFGGAAIGATVSGAISAIAGATAGAAGAAILKTVGHVGYEVLEAARVVAGGNALLGGALGGVVGGVAGGVLGGNIFKHIATAKDMNTTYGYGLVGYIASQTLGGLIGYELFMRAGTLTMTLGQIAVSSAVGATVTAIPVTVGLIYCIGLTASCITIVVSLAIAAETVEDKVEKEIALKVKEIANAIHHEDNTNVSENKAEFRIKM